MVDIAPEVGPQAIRSNSQVLELLIRKPLQRGEAITGKIVALGQEGAWIDIGSKSEGIIPPGEMRSLVGGQPLKAGDEVMALVLQAEGKEGRAILSLDRASRLRAWKDIEKHLASGEPMEAVVTAFNKGGLIVNYQGVEGFVPNSQVMGLRQNNQETGTDWLSQKVGQKLMLKVIELNHATRRLIFSERIAWREEKEKQREQLLAELKEGDLRCGRITGLHDFGVFVDLGGIEGLAPVSELTWDKGCSPALAVGQETKCRVLRVDREKKRLLLSLRQAQPDPWDGLEARYQPGQQVKGMVTKLMPYGAFVRLDGYPIEGLVHISELSDRRIVHPREVVHEGDCIGVRILNVDTSRRQMRLSLRQAESEL